MCSGVLRRVMSTFVCLVVFWQPNNLVAQIQREEVSASPTGEPSVSPEPAGLGANGRAPGIKLMATLASAVEKDEFGSEVVRARAIGRSLFPADGFLASPYAMSNSPAPVGQQTPIYVSRPRFYLIFGLLGAVAGGGLGALANDNCGWIYTPYANCVVTGAAAGAGIGAGVGLVFAVLKDLANP